MSCLLQGGVFLCFDEGSWGDKGRARKDGARSRSIFAVARCDDGILSWDSSSHTHGSVENANSSLGQGSTSPLNQGCWRVFIFIRFWWEIVAAYMHRTFCRYTKTLKFGWQHFDDNWTDSDARYSVLVTLVLGILNSRTIWNCQSTPQVIEGHPSTPTLFVASFDPSLFQPSIEDCRNPCLQWKSPWMFNCCAYKTLWILRRRRCRICRNLWGGTARHR